MRARWALDAAQIAVVHREVLLREKPAALLAVSPKGTVPVLVLTGGTLLDESLDIMRWALAQHDPEGWLQADHAAVQRLIDCNDGPFKQALDRYKYAERHPDKTPAEHRQHAASFLTALEARLQTEPWLTGARCSLADVALFPFVRQMARVDEAWFQAAPWPGLRRWRRHFESSDRFERIMRKHPRWLPVP